LLDLQQQVFPVQLIDLWVVPASPGCRHDLCQLAQTLLWRLLEQLLQVVLVHVLAQSEEALE